MARVLIADDSELVRLSLVRSARERGLEIVEASSAEDAKRVDVTALSCALLDLDLGDGFGTDVAEVLRGASEALPIAFFTSEREGPARTRASTFGPVFRKPDQLDAAITWVAKHARAADE
jgi:CheY-like chemotaxis protein